MNIESKLVTALTSKLDEQDEHAKRMLTEGNLPDFATVKEWHGRRKALADCKALLTETFEDLMKE